MRWLLRPYCRIFGDRAASVLTMRGPLLRCRRCGLVLGSPLRSGGPLG